MYFRVHVGPLGENRRRANKIDRGRIFNFLNDQFSMTSILNVLANIADVHAGHANSYANTN